MRLGVIGYKGFIGSAIVRAANLKGFEVELIGKDYQLEKTGCFDAIVDANGNSRKYIADTDPHSDFLMSVASVSLRATILRARTYVYLSSGEVYGPVQTITNSEETLIDRSIRKSNYGFHKLLAESLISHYAERSLIIRLGGFVGPGLVKNPVFDILNGNPIRVNPRSKFQFIDIDFASNLILDLVGNRSSGIFNLASKDTITPEQIGSIAGVAVNCLHSDLPLEHHELNIRKLESTLMTTIPSTKIFVSEFILWRARLGAKCV
jgi:nucleoside-diphosphate-sugar epimerase